MYINVSFAESLMHEQVMCPLHAADRVYFSSDLRYSDCDAGIVR